MGVVCGNAGTVEPLEGTLTGIISTGNVMKLNRVLIANRPMPRSSRPGKLSTKMIPANKIHDTHLEANDTTGTRAERIFRGP